MKTFKHYQSGVIKTKEEWEQHIDEEKLNRNIDCRDHWIVWDMNFNDYVNTGYLIEVQS